MKKSLSFIFLSLFSLSTLAQDVKVGVCDWMILKRQKMGEFELAHEIGADGIEMDMGGLGKNDVFDNKMRTDEASVKLFRHLSDSLNVPIGAVAMSGFYGQSFATKATYKELVEDCLQTMQKMGNVRVAFLPLGGCGSEWYKDKQLRKTIVDRLHEVGEMAHKQGKVIGIDTPFGAADNLKFLKEIKSKGIGIFYKWQTIVELGLDIPTDMQKLGAKNIVAMHSSVADSVCLRDDKSLSVSEIKKAIDKMKWSGWMFVERSRDVRRIKSVATNYANNVDYLKGIFNIPIVADVALDSAGRDAKYVQTILSRSKKVTDELNISYTRKGRNVLNIVANRYFKLNDIYAERDETKKTDKKLAEATADAKLYRYHFDLEARLANYLNPKQIETVKDVMTYNVVRVTYEAQCDMIPTLTKEEKRQILAWLIEAREFAMDAENSNKKHAAFGKYKGRINNYLSSRGYDLTKEREAWAERVKARGGTL